MAVNIITLLVIYFTLYVVIQVNKTVQTRQLILCNHVPAVKGNMHVLFIIYVDSKTID